MTEPLCERGVREEAANAERDRTVAWLRMSESMRYPYGAHIVSSIAAAIEANQHREVEQVRGQ